jgi:hypothetical protein
MSTPNPAGTGNPTAEEMPFKDDLDVREIFSTRSRHVHFDGHDVHIELIVDRPAAVVGGRVQGTSHPVARLVLPPVGAAILYEQLSTIVAALEQRGLIRRLTPAEQVKPEASGPRPS